MHAPHEACLGVIDLVDFIPSMIWKCGRTTINPKKSRFYQLCTWSLVVLVGNSLFLSRFSFGNTITMPVSSIAAQTAV